MRHRAYEKIGGPGARLEGDLGGRWVAVEKVHGAQLVVAVAGGEVRFGKRKAWLADDDPFFGWQLVRAELAEGARAAAALAGAPAVVLYGELFGGGYPHPDVAAVPELQPVQTGVWYAPDLRWAIFDIVVASDEDDPGERLAFGEVRQLASSAGLLVPPVVRAGRRTEVEATAERFPTLVPAQLGLPPIDGNLAEGLVLRRDARARPGEAVIYKRKIDEFAEDRFGEAEAWDADQRPGLDALRVWARRLTNPARVASATSKWGHHDVDAVLDEVELDVLIDLAEAFPAVARTPSAADEAALRAEIREAAAALL
jgi:Rnl2 family RNA ligase